MQYEPGMFPIANLENAGQKSMQIKGAKQKHYTNNENMYNMSHGISGYSALVGMFGQDDGSIAQGALYDIQDLSSMYQNASDLAIPVTLESSVGLVLDSRYNGARGKDLAEAAGWNLTFGTSWNLSGKRITLNTVSGGRATTNALTLVPGRYYEIEVTTDQLSTGVRLGTLADGSAPGAILNITNLTPGTYTLLVKATAATMYLTYLCVLVNSTATGSVSIKEVPGNHAYQATAANRPIVSARYNLLNATNDFGNFVWTKQRSSYANGKLIEDTTITNTHEVWLTGFTAIGNGAIVYRVKAKAAERTGIALDITDLTSGDAYCAFDLITGTVGSTIAGGSWTAVSGAISGPDADGYYLCTLFATKGAGTQVSAKTQLMLGNATAYTGDGTSGAFVKEPDLRTLSDATLNIPPYQRVTSATDYDSIGFPKYLKGNGTTQFLQTDAIDFTGTDKMTVIAGVGKLSDAARAFVMFHDTGGAQRIAIEAPNGAGLPQYVVVSGGTINSAVAATPYTAPINNVVTDLGDISGDSVIARINGMQVAQSGADQGTGTYSNAPLYILSNSTPGIFFGGRLYGLAICGRAVNPYPLFLAEEEMGSKMGIELS